MSTSERFSLFLKVQRPHTNIFWPSCPAIHPNRSATLESAVCVITPIQRLGCEYCVQNDDTEECPYCSKVQRLKKLLMDAFDDMGVEEITYKAWVSVDRSQLETLTKCTEDFVDELLKQLSNLRVHDFIAKQQAAFLEETKPGEAVVLGDFSENYSFVIQDAVQGFHWNNDQATIHPFIAYWRPSVTQEGTHNEAQCSSSCNEAQSDATVVSSIEGSVQCGTSQSHDQDISLRIFSYVVISDCLVHDAVSVHYFVKNFLDFLALNIKGLKKVYYFTDGASSQYKNRKNFINLAFHMENFNVEAEWHFFATAHGKGPCDGIGGTVKRLATKGSLQRPFTDQIQTPIQLYEWAKGAIKSVHFQFISTTEYEAEDLLLRKRLDSALTIVGTHSFHAYYPIPNETNKVVMVEDSSTPPDESRPSSVSFTPRDEEKQSRLTSVPPSEASTSQKSTTTSECSIAMIGLGLDHPRPTPFGSWPATIDGDVMEREFTQQEVRDVMKRMPYKSAPGPDQVTYAYCRGIDPTSSIITKILETCRRYKKIPASWKNSITILIHKGDDPAVIKNPISLHCRVQSTNSKSTKVMQEMLMAIQFASNWAGLTLTLSRQFAETYSPKLNGELSLALIWEDHCTHLGCKVGADHKSKATAQGIESWAQRMDKEIRNMIKQVFKLPRRTISAFLHASPHSKGYGISCIEDEIDVHLATTSSLARCDAVINYSTNKISCYGKTISWSGKKNTGRTLRAKLLQRHLYNLQQASDQGRISKCVVLHPSSNH
ncbi:hypothetical protein EMCRGX_G005586 [Ephydatia muelleri]